MVKNPNGECPSGILSKFIPKKLAIIFGIDKTKLENTIYDAIIGDVSVKKVTIPTFIKNLFIVPSNISLSGAGVELSKKENYHIVLKETLKDLPPLFDYIFIDLPTSLGVLMH